MQFRNTTSSARLAPKSKMSLNERLDKIRSSPKLQNQQQVSMPPPRPIRVL